MRFMRSSVKIRSEEHTSELQSRGHFVCRLLLDSICVSYMFLVIFSLLLSFSTRRSSDLGVTWLDDVIDIKIPLELIDNDILETYYKNDNALFTFEVEEGKEVEATDAIYEIIGEDKIGRAHV